MQTLKQQIKDKSIKGVYIFFGEETYVRDTYITRVIKSVFGDEEQAMNLDIFTSDIKDISRITDAMDTLPFLAPHRLVIVKDLGILKKKGQAKAKGIVEAIERMPESTILVIAEQSIEKTTDLYKKIKSCGQIIDFKPLNEQDLAIVIANQLSRAKLQIDKPTAIYIIQYVGADLSLIYQEIEKLIGYKLGQDIITKKDVEICCTKSIENKIFDLVDAIGRKNKSHAIRLYHDLILAKEIPLHILYMITRQFRINLQCALLHKKKKNEKELATLIKVPAFVVSKSLNQTRHFSIKQLKKALNDCLKVEMQFKTGAMAQELAVELLIIEYST
ncbi:MAG: DNA polymerase III subunit delta [Vallitaleaceae bacterium]|jgi:DNA polymerase-3 subunit delta|nr:DNA polymerase III subunit delta [Vallitaleaceae bacterium]